MSPSLLSPVVLSPSIYLFRFALSFYCYGLFVSELFRTTPRDADTKELGQRLTKTHRPPQGDDDEDEEEELDEVPSHSLVPFFGQQSLHTDV